MHPATVRICLSMCVRAVLVDLQTCWWFILAHWLCKQDIFTVYVCVCRHKCVTLIEALLPQHNSNINHYLTHTHIYKHTLLL